MWVWGQMCFLNEFTKSHYQGARSLETFIQNMVIVRTRCLLSAATHLGGGSRVRPREREQVSRLYRRNIAVGSMVHASLNRCLLLLLMEESYKFRPDTVSVV